MSAVDGQCTVGYALAFHPGYGNYCKTMYSLGYRYVSSLYWAFTTMTTVGYGDINATTFAERIYNIFALIIGGFMFSGIISRMGSILSTVDAADRAQSERMEMIKVFLRDSKLPHNLRGPVLTYFKEQKVKSYDIRKVLQDMPFELRSRVAEFIFRNEIKYVPVLSHRTDDTFMTDLCMRLEKYNLTSFTYLYQRGETSSDLIVLLRGHVVIVDIDKQSILAQLEPGALCGVSSIVELIQVRTMRSPHVPPPPDTPIPALCALTSTPPLDDCRSATTVRVGGRTSSRRRPASSFGSGCTTCST